MDSKFSIPADGLSWTLAKPAMLVAAVFGGMSPQPVPEAHRLAPAPPPLAQGPAAEAPAAPGFSAFALAAPAPRTALVTAAGTPRPSRVATPHLLVPARAAFADLAVPETPAAEPALAETALVSAVAPWPALEVTSSGEVFPALQQSISAASAETAIAEALIDLRLPGSPLAEPAAAPGQAPAIRFVSIPVVQQVTETAVETGAARPELVLGAAPAALPTAAPAALASPAPAKATAPAKAAPAALARPEQPQPRMASAFAPAAKAKAMTAPVGKAGPGYTVTNGTIDFALATRINGQPAGALPLRVTPDDRLWLRMRDLLLLVRERMNPLEFDRIAMSSSLEDYVEFDTVRRAGIALRYDAARNQIDLGVN